MNKNLIIFLILITFFSCFQNTNAKENINKTENSHKVRKTFALKDYQEDFRKMLKILVETHPQPYAFISEDSFNKLAETEYAKITDSTTIGEFLLICRRVVTAINCGHTYMWFPAKFGKVSKSLLFPIEAKYVDSRLYVIDARENTNTLLEGDEILKINGVKVTTIKKEIFEQLPADGFNETVKQESINLSFYWFCSLYFNFPSSYTLSVDRNGKLEEITLKEAENFKAKKTFLDNCQNRLCFDIDQETNTAILTIRSFGFYKKKLPVFKSFIDSCFNHIKENKIENLIIDLRNNGGGDPFCGSYLVQYITNKPFIYFDEDAKRYSSLKKTIQPKANAFTNKPYILTNGLCFSTTGHFCSLVKENNLGVFVGDETAGTYTCNDNSKNFTLKKTKLVLRVARGTYKTTATTLSNKQGVKPDHYVMPTIDNVLNNTDVVLNYTLKLIEKEKLVSQEE